MYLKLSHIQNHDVQFRDIYGRNKAPHDAHQLEFVLSNDLVVSDALWLQFSPAEMAVVDS